MGRFARIVILLALSWLLIVAATSAANLQPGWLVPGGKIKLDRQFFNSKDHKYIALTFDDGPDQHGYTLQVSDVLVQYGVPGTFFLIGERAKAYPDQVKELAARGHEIGVHCYSHKQFTHMSAEKQSADITKCQELLASLGAQPRWFRPPYGEFNKSTTAAASKLGLQTVLWTNDPRDWSQPGVQTIVRRVLRDTTPGGVILLHSTNAQTVAALPAIIDQLTAKGYQFVTMSQWQAALSGQAVQAAKASSESFAPAVPDTELPRVVEEIEAQSPADHAQLLWSSIRALGQDNAASQAASSWVPQSSEPAPEQSSEPAPERYTVYSNFKSAADIVDVQRKGGRQHLATFVDSAPAFLPAPVPAPNPPVAPLPEAISWEAGAQPGSVVETPVQPGSEVPALPAGEELVVAPDTPASAHVVTEAPAVTAPPLVLEIPPLKERQPLPSRSSDLVDKDNPQTAWQTPAGIDTGNFANHGTYSGADGLFREPNFYFLNIAGTLEDYTWVELETFVRVGRLKGMVLADEFSASPPSVAVSYPWKFYGMRWLDRGAVIDLTVEDTADVIDALKRGKENLFIVVRPANLHFFIAAQLWAEMNYNMQDFVLLRQLTSGLSYDPASGLEQLWQLPPGVQLARFTDGRRSAIVLYSKLRQPQAVTVPPQFAYYSQAQIDAGGFLRVEPLASTEVSVSYRPVVLYYEYGQP
jgi:peptidoglycan-N-acetylglucosamine deacetylase